MKSKSIVILTEGGKNLGFGHITRTISITNIFIKNNFKRYFIINGDTSLNNVLKDLEYEIYNWLDCNDLSNKLKKFDYILLDSILISNTQIKEIESFNIPIIFIDDDKRRNIIDAGYVLDWTIFSEKENYFTPKKDKVTYLQGSKFTPLRDEFNLTKKNIINDNIKSVLITFGGSDIRNITPKILQILNTIFPDIVKNIVIGGGYDNIKEIEDSKDINTKLIYNATASTMSKLMKECDLAIASGGQTLYELAIVGIPTIAILIVENAIDDTTGWEKAGFLYNIGWWNNTNLENNLLKALSHCKDKETRLNMQKKAFQYIEPNGAKKIFDAII